MRRSSGCEAADSASRRLGESRFQSVSFRGLDADFTGVASIHLWSHLWWERRRRDFSDFHAGLITEDYVREGRTTYAVAARPFLPSPSSSRSSKASG